ncbi:MAG: VWA domain-containing protein [Firmicutes bacterium]|nr:VWA domain-containing protein [Bacillota bacterium]MBR6970850.1 VWA domain-containing protein [Bacillota bacterium]
MEKKRNDLTELVFILDRSGSMAGLESDTIGGFNGLIDKQKKVDGKAFVTTVLFDNQQKTVHDRIDLTEVAPMTEKEYYVGGSTALLDAVGDTVTHIEKIHKYVRPEDVPAHTMVVITTDGMENSSHRWRAADVKKLVEKKKEGGWEFLFLGANIDAVSEAARFGIDADRAVRYCNDSVGVRKNFSAVGKAMASLRRDACMPASWKEEIEEDYKNRG